MKKLIVLAGLGLVLSGCIIVTPTPTPVASNLRAQNSFCATGTTNLDFKFDSNSPVANYVLYISDPTAGAVPTGRIRLSKTIAISQGAGRIAGVQGITVDTSDLVVFVDPGAFGVSPQAIDVNKAYQVWLRVTFSDGTQSPYLKAGAPTPSSSFDTLAFNQDAATCDPGASAVQ
jgi:hypothetical protein